MAQRLEETTFKLYKNQTPKKTYKLDPLPDKDIKFKSVLDSLNSINTNDQSNNRLNRMNYALK
jgi:hypothetical protein